MEYSVVSTLAIGFVVGFRHAFEPDHLVAVSTLLDAEQRLVRAVRVGFTWGLGHTSTLVAGVALVSLLGLQVVESDLRFFELPVGLMLVGLGAKTLWDAWRGLKKHAGGDAAHKAAQSHAHPKHGSSAWRSYWIGTVHGAAGSGSLLLLLATTLSSAMGAVVYALLFGLGSVIGMAAMTLLLATPLRTGRKRRGVGSGWKIVSGLLSILLGLAVFSDFLV